MKSTALKLTILSLVFTYSLAGVRTLANPSDQGGTPQLLTPSLLPEDPWISRPIEVAVNEYDKSNPAAAYNSHQNDYLVVWEQYIKSRRNSNLRQPGGW